MLASHSNKGGGFASGQLDRVTYIVGGLLVVVSIAAWIQLIVGGSAMTSTGSGGDMGGMAGMNGMSASPVSAMVAGGVAYLLAWGVMMAAMMLPSAMPMIALYAAIRRNGPKAAPRAPSAALFTFVYLLIWVAFGIPVYVLSIALAQIVGLNGALKPLVPVGIAAILVVAGVYQFTPLKQACLHACRTPLGFLMGSWRDDYWGTLHLAAHHAVTCVGCCLALMVVLVAAGAMGLAWVALIAVVVFAEKVLPYGEWTARVAGMAFVVLGLLIAARPDLVPFIQGSMAM